MNNTRIEIRNLESDLIIYIMTRSMVLVPIIVSLGIYITDLILKM